MVAHPLSRSMTSSGRRNGATQAEPQWAELAVGDRVVCPPHGVGEVVSKAVQEIGGVRLLFLRFRILGNGLQLLIPAPKLASLGLRPIVEAARVPEIWALLGRRRRSLSGTAWTKRFRAFREKLGSGSLWLAAETLRDLLLLRKDQELSLTEQRLLDEALRLVTTEVASATDTAVDEVTARVMALFSRA